MQSGTVSVVSLLQEGEEEKAASRSTCWRLEKSRAIRREKRRQRMLSQALDQKLPAVCALSPPRRAEEKSGLSDYFWPLRKNEKGNCVASRRPAEMRRRLLSGEGKKDLPLLQRWGRVRKEYRDREKRGERPLIFFFSARGGCSRETAT